MQHLELSGAVRPIYIWVVRRQTVKVGLTVPAGLAACKLTYQGYFIILINAVSVLSMG